MRVRSLFALVLSVLVISALSAQQTSSSRLRSRSSPSGSWSTVTGTYTKASCRTEAARLVALLPAGSPKQYACDQDVDIWSAAPAPVPTPTPTPVPVPVPPPTPTPPPTTSGSWPSGWNDPIFANAKTGSVNSYGLSGTTTDLSITTTSGEPMVGCQNFTLQRFRGRGREGIRTCGSNVLVEDFYIEAAGSGSDHADGFQSYSPGGHMQNIVLRRGNIIVSGAANSGIFLADNGNVDLTLDHIRVDGTGAPNGAMFLANVPGDTGVRSLSFNDVVIIGGYRFQFTGTKPTIVQWINVRDGNGVAIPKP